MIEGDAGGGRQRSRRQREILAINLNVYDINNTQLPRKIQINIYNIILILYYIQLIMTCLNAQQASLTGQRNTRVNKMIHSTYN